MYKPLDVKKLMCGDSMRPEGELQFACTYNSAFGMHTNNKMINAFRDMIMPVILVRFLRFMTLRFHS